MGTRRMAGRGREKQAVIGSAARHDGDATGSLSRGRRIAALLAMVGLLFLILAPTSALAQDDGSTIVSTDDDSANAAMAVLPSDWSPPSTVYIPETGQTLDRLFL